MLRSEKEDREIKKGKVNSLIKRKLKRNISIFIAPLVTFQSLFNT